MVRWYKDMENTINKIKSITGVAHIGYAVSDMAKAREKFSALGYEFTEEKSDNLR